MAETMIASQQEGMTDGQIDNACAKLRDALRKQRKEIGKEGAQLALGAENIGMRMSAPFREQAEALSGMIVRHVRVNRGQTPKQAIDATGRVKYVNNDVLSTMPCGEGEDKEVFFFKLGRWVSDDDLAKEYELRGLVPDPYAQAQVNTDDPSFADEHPNGCHWQAADGRWNYAAFDRWDGKRGVDVYRYGSAWNVYWWFGGVRK